MPTLRFRVPVADLNAALASLGDVNSRKAIKAILRNAAVRVRGDARSGARSPGSTGNLARSINVFASRSNVEPAAFVRVAAKTAGPGGKSTAPYAFPVEGGSRKYEGKHFMQEAFDRADSAVEEATDYIKRMIESKWGRL